MNRLGHIVVATALVVAALAHGQPANAAQYTDPSFGYSFVYPDTWHALTWTYDPGVVVLRNFDRLLHGGNVPFGGAQITVRAFPPYPPDWPQGTDEYARLNAIAARVGTIISAATRAASGPARVKFTHHTASGTDNTSIELAAHVGGRLFHIFIDYQTSDPAGPEYEQVLSDLVASLSFAAPPQTPVTTPTP